jgi:anthranilate phosphoribosyltransferase
MAYAGPAETPVPTICHGRFVMLKEVIRKTTERVNLSSTEMEAAMEEIMEGRATSAQIGCLLWHRR